MALHVFTLFCFVMSLFRELDVAPAFGKCLQKLYGSLFCGEHYYKHFGSGVANNLHFHSYLLVLFSNVNHCFCSSDPSYKIN